MLDIIKNIIDIEKSKNKKSKLEKSKNKESELEK